MAFVDAGTLSGIADDKALNIRSLILTCVSHPPTTGAGCTAFTTVPSGAFIFICL